MKKVLLGTLVTVALLTGCSEDKKPTTTQNEVTTPAAQTQTVTPNEAKKETK